MKFIWLFKVTLKQINFNPLFKMKSITKILWKQKHENKPIQQDKRVCFNFNVKFSTLM